MTFFGHDVLGAQLARDVLGRLRASVRLREHVAALVRCHLRLGFLVHEPQPLARETRVRLPARLRSRRGGRDVAVGVRSARHARRQVPSEAIDAHLALAQAMLGDALRWRREGPPRPLLRGDELAEELDIALGPRVGELLADLAQAQYAGAVSTREQAIAFVRDQGLKAGTA